MSGYHCPGQDKRFWTPEDVTETRCRRCGHVIEFFKDEPKQTCRGCGKVTMNPSIDLGCAKWCKFAEQCLGAAASAGDNSSVRENLTAEMKRVFGDDEKRIDHALQVLGYAETILEAEGGDPLVVTAAAILHDIGIQEAERKHGSSAGKYQEVEGPPIACEILKKTGISGSRADRVCSIVSNHHSAAEADTLEFNIIWDADHLVNLSDEALADSVDRVFRTATGRRLAQMALRKLKV